MLTLLVHLSRPPRGGRGLKFSLCMIGSICIGRPPRGGRGLKCRTQILRFNRELVAPREGGVD